MELLFKTVFTLNDWIAVVLAGIVILIVICSGLKSLYDRVFKKNCFDCKYWDLYNVASYGDGCDYKCSKTGHQTPHMISSNCRTYFRKCKNFESKYEK